MKKFEKKMQLQRYCGALYKKKPDSLGFGNLWKTKMSGNIGDAIKYAKPAIFLKAILPVIHLSLKEKRY